MRASRHYKLIAKADVGRNCRMQQARGISKQLEHRAVMALVCAAALLDMPSAWLTGAQTDCGGVPPAAFAAPPHLARQSRAGQHPEPSSTAGSVGQWGRAVVAQGGTGTATPAGRAGRNRWGGRSLASIAHTPRCWEDEGQACAGGHTAVQGARCTAGPQRLPAG